MKLIVSIGLVGVFALCMGAIYPKEGFVAHEWGTFTSVASLSGSPVNWAPLTGPGDLPCFVLKGGNDVQRKGLISGLIRMETPVLYFYSKTPVTASVHVDFPKGQITEWYPNGKVSIDTMVNRDSEGAYASNGVLSKSSITVKSSIDWNPVEILPDANLTFPTSKGASHYFAARETDSSPLRIGDQQEKMIFYRGVGDFLPPLWPKYISDGRIEIRNTGDSGPIPLAVVFENHGDRVGYRFVSDIRETAKLVEPPEMTGDVDQLRAALAAALEGFGLYRKEALAMVETWRDSWFEEGSRIFYIMPSAQVDPFLPLTITPKPSEVERVFVGRVELLSPWTEETIKSAMATGEIAKVRKFGRFLEPFLQQINLKEPNTKNTVNLRFAQESLSNNPDSCVE